MPRLGAKGTAWGNITGTLVAQTDLAAALDAKGDDADIAAEAAARVAADALLAPLASPGFTGNPTAPSQSTGNSSTRVATTAFVQGEFVARRYYEVFGNDVDVAYTITHSLNADVIAQVVWLADGSFPAGGVYTAHAGPNSIVVTTLAPPGVNALKIEVIA